ncbi:MAG: GntP family permease [Acetobacter sp.]|jgi:GntP family gluconate:H+ symporter|nr:GntP family permease [Acetobacter sp.]MCH4061975.1 GntP family permease [Acetobacter sp.]MCH4089176.1 GntP family permease [Acetobacter sp.]MCI1293652.1 GntP family permease [Acetobacter sp.]MCI1320267.1 GntP family permease [Acetobacter sp.]
MSPGFTIAIGSVAILAVIILITRFRLEPVMTLFGVAIAVGLAAGHSPAESVTSFEEGAGHALGHIAFIIAFGTMLGRIITESGAAERIAETLIQYVGARNVHWAMMAIGLLVGLPVFFDVGFVLLAPLAFVAARAAGQPILLAALPLAASLSVAHALMPPHPAIMIAMQAYHASMPLMLLLGAVVAVPAAVLTGPIFAHFVVPRLTLRGISSLEAQFLNNAPTQQMPPFWLSVLAVLMPILLILAGLIISTLFPGTIGRTIGGLICSTDVALVLSTVFACIALTRTRGLSKNEICRHLSTCLAPIAFVVLLVGAGSGFGRALIDAGVSHVLTELAINWHMPPLFLACGIAAVVRLATGSATVAMSTAAPILAPFTQQTGLVSPEAMVLATGAGSVAFGPVTDPFFWQIKEYLGLSVGQTILTWSVIETSIAVLALGGAIVFQSLTFLLS